MCNYEKKNRNCIVLCKYPKCAVRSVLHGNPLDVCEKLPLVKYTLQRKNSMPVMVLTKIKAASGGEIRKIL